MDNRTFGERLSDGLAAFGGSWRFLIEFAFILVVWMAFNVVMRHVDAAYAFDPYPFILLNLCLSCLAAVQAPVIMMSQGRAEAKDRQRAELDLRVNRASLFILAELATKHGIALPADMPDLSDEGEVLSRIA